MYQITIPPNVPSTELEELVKMFLPGEEWEMNREEALADNQSFSVVFDGKTISPPLTEVYYQNQPPRTTKEWKNTIKRGLYETFHTHLGKALPWGILTGVKPAKIPRALWQRGWEPERIRQYMRTYYLLREDKIQLLMEIVRRQEKMGWIVPEHQVGIYIGIPFCPTRCVYCSFPANVADTSAQEAYLAALEQEIDFVSKRMRERGMYADVFYVGGGTPTALSASQLDRLLDTVVRSFDMADVQEFTVEAGRPDTITKEKMTCLARHDIRRISVNPQSMQQKTLQRIGRMHTPEDILRAMDIAREAGMDTINMDLIAGLPDETFEDFQDSLEKVRELHPENITVHTLAVKRASRLKEAATSFSLSSVEEVSRMVETSRQWLSQQGYVPYYLYRQKYMVGNLENVGYSLPGRECRYNVRTMDEEQTILALGAGGISKRYFPEEDRIERTANVSNYEIYIQRIEDMLRRKEELLFAN